MFFLYFENTFETKNKEEYKNILGVLFSYEFFMFMYTYSKFVIAYGKVFMYNVLSML